MKWIVVIIMGRGVELMVLGKKKGKRVFMMMVTVRVVVMMLVVAVIVAVAAIMRKLNYSTAYLVSILMAIIINTIFIMMIVKKIGDDSCCVNVSPRDARRDFSGLEEFVEVLFLNTCKALSARTLRTLNLMVKETSDYI